MLLFKKSKFLFKLFKNLKRSEELFLFSSFRKFFLIMRKGISKIFFFSNMFNVHISDISFLKIFCLYLKKHTFLQYKNLIDLTAIDFLNKNLDFRFKLVYNFLSFFQNRRFLLSLFFSEISVNSLYSLSFIFKNANWLEREIWDLFGIFFCNHPDLRRILTDYGFEGFPLRKDFPTVGFVEVRYDDEKKSILYEPVSFSQEFRTFSFSSPWPQFH